jgi:hypothetical protein
MQLLTGVRVFDRLLWPDDIIRGGFRGGGHDSIVSSMNSLSPPQQYAKTTIRAFNVRRANRALRSAISFRHRILAEETGTALPDRAGAAR